jgi:hypothetical protein
MCRFWDKFGQFPAGFELNLAEKSVKLLETAEFPKYFDEATDMCRILTPYMKVTDN